MYIEFYGLTELPFALTPDPRFIYFTPSHTEVMANLHYGIESGKGLIVVTGEADEAERVTLQKEWESPRVRFATNLPLPQLAAIRTIAAAPTIPTAVPTVLRM